MAVKKDKEVQARASAEMQKSFNLTKFKEKKGFGAENAKYKPQTWIPLSEAWQKATGLPGVPQGHITIFRGVSDTGKTAAMLECAASCQKLGILPVLIVTEMKFSFEFARKIGFEYKEKIDPDTGEITGYDGFFLYADRSTLSTIEDVANFIGDLLDDQKKGNLPYDLCFLWDSVGSVPCKMSVESNSNSNMWNAGAMSQSFGGYIDQLIVLSRKQTSPYLNTLCVTNKTWNVIENTFTGQVGIRNKGGNALFYDASLVVNYGNPGYAGTAKCIVRAEGNDLVWGKKTNISVDKCHLDNVYHKGKAIMTATGFILEEEAEEYKAKHKKEWAQQLGAQADGLTFEEIEEDLEESAGFMVSER